MSANTKIRFGITFDAAMYRATGKRLIESIRQHMPDAAIAVYPEGDCGMDCLHIDHLDLFVKMFYGFRQYIPVEDGIRLGTPYEERGQLVNAIGFQRRWFQWFRKVAAEHHAIHHPEEEAVLIWLDSDVIVKKPFTVDDLRKYWTYPIGMFFGQDRESVEAGVVLYHMVHSGPREFIDRIVELYLSGQFVELKRWDDGYVMRHVWREMQDRHLIQDLAEGKKGRKYKTSTGDLTGGQVIFQTPFGEWFEHEKGRHWRVDKMDPRTAGWSSKEAKG